MIFPELLKIYGRNELFIFIYFLISFAIHKGKKGNDINSNKKFVIC